MFSKSRIILFILLQKLFFEKEYFVIRGSGSIVFTSGEGKLCNHLSNRNRKVNLIYFKKQELICMKCRYGRSTASSQYLLQLAGYLGIPVIAWNADNSGLEKVREFQGIS